MTNYCIIRAFNAATLSRRLFQKTPNGWKQTEKPQKRLWGMYWKMKIKREQAAG